MATSLGRKIGPIETGCIESQPLFPQERGLSTESIIADIRTRKIRLQDLSFEHQGDRDIVLAAVEVDGYAFTHATRELQKNKALALVAVKNSYPSSFLDKDLQEDIDIGIASVEAGYPLEFLYIKLSSNRKVVLAAVKKDGKNLEGASLELQNDKEIVRIAVNNYGLALQFASEQLRNNKKIVLTAVARDKRAIQFASIEMQKDEDIMRAVQQKTVSIAAIRAPSVS